MDIVDKLRSYNPTSGYSRVMREAANEIERLRAALEEIAFGLPEPQSLSKCREVARYALKLSENDPT